MSLDETTTSDVELNDNENHDVEDTEDNSGNDDNQTDTTDWKSEALKYKAILDRNKNKQPRTESKTNNSGELGLSEKSFLIVNGIKGSDEMKLVKDMMRESGKDLETVIESKYFKSELEEMRALRETANANPTGSKRSGQSSADSVDYWIAKGELPPASNPELRRQVVNARLKKSESNSPFYNG